MNWTVVPLAMEELLAFMLIDWSVAAVTVSAKLFDVMPFWAAVMLLDPIAAPVARPAAPMLTVAEMEEAQDTVWVRSCVLPSLKVPVAAN